MFSLFSNDNIKSKIVIKNRAYQIPPTKKQEIIVRRNKIKFKIGLHSPISVTLFVPLLQIIISYSYLFIKPSFLSRIS